MDISNAPVADREDDAECDVESCGGTYVLYDNDRVCDECGHLSGTGNRNGDSTMGYREEHLPEPWVEYEKEREQYSGFYGEDRIKFPGGFASAYDFGDDFLAR